MIPLALNLESTTTLKLGGDSYEKPVPLASRRVEDKTQLLYEESGVIALANSDEGVVELESFGTPIPVDTLPALLSYTWAASATLSQVDVSMTCETTIDCNVDWLWTANDGRDPGETIPLAEAGAENSSPHTVSDTFAGTSYSAKTYDTIQYKIRVDGAEVVPYTELTGVTFTTPIPGDPDDGGSGDNP